MMTLKLAVGVLAMSATAYLALLGGLHGPPLQQSVANAISVIPSAFCAAQHCTGQIELR
jgi:hypothetical protein